MASSSDDSEGYTRPAIWDAIYTFDAEALRRELAAGVDPNVSYDGYTPLFNLVLVRAARYPEERIQERLECISVLLEAGASVNLMAGVAAPAAPLRDPPRRSQCV